MSDILGSLMKGLSGFMPQDDPNTQIYNLQTEVKDLKKKEDEIYIQIGKQAMEQYGAESFGELNDKLKLIQMNITDTSVKLEQAQAEKEQKEAVEKAAREQRQAEERAARAQRTCLSCGLENPEGTKFCQECGTKLGVQNLCPSCGHGNPTGVNFCQECGTKLGASELKCPSCGKENPAGTRFCGDCGTKLEG